MEKLRVVVLMGGTSNERDVSLLSGARILEGLDRARYDVRPLDFTGDVKPIVALRGAADVVVLALHGRGGEDGSMQGLLDLLEIPYTGSGVLGSAVAMHKGVAKMLYLQAGIPTPAGVTLRAFGDESSLAAQVERVQREVGVPCVIKPANEGSSVGLTLVRDPDRLADAIADAFCFDTELIAESFATGMEISVPVLGTTEPRALPAIEIIPQSGIYDYEAKYTPGATEEICPARLSETVAAKAADYAVRAHLALQCRGVSRTDMIVTGDDLVVLETNTLPGMTGTSLLPLSAGVAGISFSVLLDQLIAFALEQEPG